MIVTDASIWVSLLHTKDSYHQATRTWLTNSLAAGTQMYAPTLLPVEVSGAIARRNASSRVGRLALQSLISFDFLTFAPNSNP